MATREYFSTRLGFLLIAAGCAIGLGNVWRFPYITGQYGGAIFVLIYVFFLVAFGLPLLMMELAIGRASRRSLAGSFECLQANPSGKWHYNKYWMIAGNYILMSFYSVITGWLLYYCIKGFSGEFGVNADAATSGAEFTDMLASPSDMVINMMAVVAVSFGICACGLRKGVERITKPMMLLLFGLLIFLAIRSCMLPGVSAGLEYYLMPDFSKIEGRVIEVLSAAMAQAFFTLSIGIGAMQIFGTYMDSRHTLASEGLSILALDTTVAFLSGLVIFPSCFSYGIEPGQGPSLIFVTLVSVFSHMDNGAFWGGFFFMFMLFAAMSTLIAVFENIIAITMELFTTSRRRAVMVNFVVILVISLPCILGFNYLSDFHPLGGSSSVLDLEDFLISYNILPFGALVICLFITAKSGWGWNKFLTECNTGEGVKMPSWGLQYYRFVVPVVIFLLIANCYYTVFFAG